MKYEGRLLNLGTINKENIKFSEDCILNVLDKIPVLWCLNFDIDSVIGNAEIIRDADGLSCKVNLTNENLIDNDEYYVGGYFTDVESHFEGRILIIESAKLSSMSITFAPADKDLIIKKSESDR